MIDKAIVNHSPKAHCRFAPSICGDGRTPDGLPSASMTIPFDCHFAQRSAGRATPGDPLTQAPAPVGWAFQSLLLWMVPQAGLEPALLSEQDFESSASTNSTTGAWRHAYNAGIKTRNGKCKLGSLFR